jgi:serine/threonine protein kinase
MMSAADDLNGMQLADGWSVVAKMGRNPNGTGGTFSQSYKVEKEGRKGFLKAFDFSEAFEPGANTTELIQILTSAYNFEKTILEHCQQRKLSKVVMAVDSGQVQVPGYGVADGRVFYLIFEMAESDIRCQINATDRFDAAVCMQVLKDISLALWQVHREMIAHQDVKPSNVLSFGPKGFKIADFGRSSRKGHSIWYDERNIAGDKTYAPPELLYGYRHPDFAPRRIGCDLYMLGNLAAFLFSGTNMTASLFSKLDRQYHPNVWNLPYADVLPYLQNAFASVLSELEPLIDEVVRADTMQIVKQLCNPDLAQRGHPRGVGRSEQYSLERYVSQLNLLAQRTKLKMRGRGAAA